MLIPNVFCGFAASDPRPSLFGKMSEDREDLAVHELSIAQSLMEIVIEEGQKHALKQVKVIKLQVGELAAVVPDSLTFCFEMVSKDTLAEGARLEIETVPVVARCSRCDILFEVENHLFSCPQCGDPTLELVSGRDLAVMSIEGELGEDNDADQCSRSS